MMAYLILRYLAARLKRKPEIWDIPEIKVIVRCKKCNIMEQTSYELGYTIGQTLTKSCNCGGGRTIERMYSDIKTEKEKKWEQYKALFR